MSQPTTGERPLSAAVVIAQNVRPEKEEEYLRWQTEINAAYRTVPRLHGQRGVPARAQIDGAVAMGFGWAL